MTTAAAGSATWAPSRRWRSPGTASPPRPRSRSRCSACCGSLPTPSPAGSPRPGRLAAPGSPVRGNAELDRHRQPADGHADAQHRPGDPADQRRAGPAADEEPGRERHHRRPVDVPEHGEGDRGDRVPDRAEHVLHRIHPGQRLGHQGDEQGEHDDAAGRPEVSDVDRHAEYAGQQPRAALVTARLGAAAALVTARLGAAAALVTIRLGAAAALVTIRPGAAAALVTIRPGAAAALVTIRPGAAAALVTIRPGAAAALVT